MDRTLLTPYHLDRPLDAHGDFNTWETSPSGFLGGMPLAMLAGRGEQTFMTDLALTPIDDGRIVLCDARDLDPEERAAPEGSRVHHHPAVASLAASGRLVAVSLSTWNPELDEGGRGRELVMGLLGELLA